MITYATKLAAWDIQIGAWMEKNGYSLLRWGIGIVFLWFGALKPFGLSPDMVLAESLTRIIPIPRLDLILGSWEMAVGLCFLWRPLLRAGILLLILHMFGTLFPFFLAPEQLFSHFPFGLKLEAQYIIKNLVLGAAAIVIGGKVRHKMSGFTHFAPDEFNTLLHLGKWKIVQANCQLAVKGEPLQEIMFIQAGRVAVLDGELQLATLGSGQFVGEMSFMTGKGASATVKTLEPCRVIYWDKNQLRDLLAKDEQFQHAFMATLNLDLMDKLRHSGSKSPDSSGY